MKKLTLIIAVLFMGCGYAPMDNKHPIIIKSMSKSSDNLCNYYGSGNSAMVFTNTSFDFLFRDTCGKFQIGDTLNFVKLKK